MTLHILQVVPKDIASVWPQTAVGWATFFLAVLGIIGAIYSYAKVFVQLNGLGERVNAVERDQKASAEREAEWLRSLQRVLDAHERIVERLGAADRDVKGCSDAMEQFAIDIGSKVDDLRRTVNAEGRQAGERLKAIETELQLTRRPLT